MISRADLCQYCLSDMIVVWRACVLWPGNRTIRWVLGLCMVAALGKILHTPVADDSTLTEHPLIACTTVNAVMTTIKDLQFEPIPHYYAGIYSRDALKGFLYIPLIATNFLATTCICYRAWCVKRFKESDIDKDWRWHIWVRFYRKDICTFTTTTSASSNSKSLGRIFALFIETGALYIIFFVRRRSRIGRIALADFT